MFNLSNSLEFKAHGISTPLDKKDSVSPFYSQIGLNIIRGIEIESVLSPDHSTPILHLSEVFSIHREFLQNSIKRLLHSLRPSYLRIGGADRPNSEMTTEIRIHSVICEGSDKRKIRIFILQKTYSPDSGVTSREVIDSFRQRAMSASIKLNDLVSRGFLTREMSNLDLEDVYKLSERWETDRFVSIELRRCQPLKCDRSKVNIYDFDSFRKSVEESSIKYGMPSLKFSTPDLANTFKVLSNIKDEVCISIKTRPTVLTALEIDALESISSEEPELSKRLLDEDTLFWTSIAVVARTIESSERVASVLNSELRQGDWGKHSEGYRFAQLPVIFTVDSLTFFYNLKNIEFYPWGAISAEVAKAYQPDHASNPNVIKFTEIPDAPTNEYLRMYNPDCYLKREIETRPQFSRIRGLYSLNEILGFWTLPVPSPLESPKYFVPE